MSPDNGQSNVAEGDIAQLSYHVTSRRAIAAILDLIPSIVLLYRKLNDS